MKRADSKRALMIAAAVATTLSAAQAGFVQTGAGPYDYNTAANWADGDINGVWDSSLTLTATQVITFGSDTTLTTPLVFNYGASGNFDLNLRSDGTGDRVLTLGGNVSDNTALTRTTLIGSFTGGQKLVVNLGGATRTFDIASHGSRTVNFRNGFAGGSEGIVKIGAGTLQMEAASTYTGPTTVNAGNLWLGSSASITGSDAVVNGGTLRFDSSGSGNTSFTRTKSVTLNGGNLTGTAASSTSVNTNDQMGVLTANSSVSTITLTPHSSRNMKMTAASFERNNNATVLFRGTNLGVNTLASNTVGATNFVISTPVLTGGLVKGAYGDVTTNGSGSGLVTYDADYGLRLVPSYNDNLAAGGHVRFQNSSGTPIAATLTDDVTIDSLSFDVSGAASGNGVTISGTEGKKLIISSGTIFARQNVTGAAAADAMIITGSTVDLAGGDGVFIVPVTSGISNGISPAALDINTAIDNDGGRGISKTGAGVMKMTGSASNSYTGDTYVNSGALLLAKTSADAIPADTTLVVNGGTVYQGNNQIADSANVVVNSGVYVLSSSSSNGNRSTESLNNFTINGGSSKNGQSRGGYLGVQGDFTMNGGTFSGIGDGSNIVVTGKTTFDGGTATLAASTSSTSFNSLWTMNGGLEINNPADGAYTPLTLTTSGTADNNGARVILASDLTFTGNATNSQSATIAVTTNVGQRPTIALTGSRTFTIGDGAATEDLVVAPNLVDGATTGSLTKAGSGTLLLTGASTYTGDTTITAGILTLGAKGSIATSPRIEITAGASFDTSAQSFAMLADQTIEFGLDPAGAGSAGLLKAAALDISAAVVDFSVLGTLDDSVYILATYTPELLTGTQFATITNQPAGYSIDYSYSGNSIALVVPEPGTIALASMVAGMSLLARRRHA